MATEARRLTTQPPKSAFTGDCKELNKNAPTKSEIKRASIIRNMNNTQMTPDKDKGPGTNNMKWRFGDRIKAASTNVRGMRDPIKRE